MTRIAAKARINLALRAVKHEIAQSTDQASVYSRGLASEGYSGGYADALMDVLLVLDNVIPNRHNYWAIDDKPKRARKVAK